MTKTRYQHYIFQQDVLMFSFLISPKMQHMVLVHAQFKQKEIIIFFFYKFSFKDIEN